MRDDREVCFKAEILKVLRASELFTLFGPNSKARHRKCELYLRCLVTRGSVSADGTKALLGKHRPWAVGRHLLQAQWRFHIIGAADCMEP